MASVLSPRSISYNQDLVLVGVFWAYFTFIGYLTCNTGFWAFQMRLLMEYGGGPEKDRDVCVLWWCLYVLSPRIRLANLMSFGMMVTRLVWMAHRLVSLNRPTIYASTASWRHSMAADWNRRSVLKSWAISLTNL